MPWLLGLVVGILAALPAVEASDDIAAEYCSRSSPSRYTEPIDGVLPVDSNDSAHALARFAMPYAALVGHASNRADVDIGHFGFYPGPKSNELFLVRRQGEIVLSLVTGFESSIYVHCRDDAIVIIYGAVNNKDPRDVVTAIVRRYSGGESELALSLLDAARERYPGYAITLVGLSAGGSLASYVGSVSGLPSVLFNPARTGASLYNNGSNQLVVRIVGDVLSDPAAPPAPGIMRISQRLSGNDGAIQGTLLLIDPIGDYRFLWELHWIETVIDEMRWILE